MTISQQDAEVQVGMSMQDFLEAQEDQAFEILDGERVDKMPNVWSHSWLIRFLFKALDRWCAEHWPGGEVFQETTYAVMEDKAWVSGSRIPDLMIFAPDRVPAFLEAIGRDPKRPFAIAPDLTIEVLSDSETATLVNKKVAADLACGVRLIWIIDPWQQVVHEYKGSEVRRLSQGEVLTGHDVLPGFRLPLSELFAQVR